MKEDKKHARILLFDILRAVSVIFVVLAHVRANFFNIFIYLKQESQTISSKLFYFITSFSDDAVIVFFLLSGYLVGGKVIESIIRRKEINFWNFVLTKFVRIFLPLAASLLFCTIVYYIVGEKPDFAKILGNLLSLQGVFVSPEGGIMWTMPYIVWSYVFIFSLILLSSYNNNYIHFGMFLFLSVLCIFLVFPHPCCFFMVALGTFCYFIKRIRIRRPFMFISLIVFVVTAVLAKFAKPSISREPTILNSLNVDVLNCIEAFFLSILISQWAKNTKVVVSLFTRFTTSISMISYSVYLTHFQTIRLLHWVGFEKMDDVCFRSCTYYFVEIIICFVVGYVFYLLVEKPTNILKYKIKRQ